MNCEAIRHIFEHSTQKGNAFTMLLTLAYLGDDTGACDKSIGELAEHARMNHRSAQAALAKLKKAEEITVDKHKGRKTASGYTNKYTVQGVQNLSSLENGGMIDQSPLADASHDRSITPSGKGVQNPAGESTSITIPVSGRLLIEAWIAAHPESKKPQYTYTPENIALSNQLASEGFTIEDVAKLTGEKWQNRTTKYEFSYLAADIRAQKQAKAANQPKPKPVHKVEKVTPLTDEQIDARLKFIREQRKLQGLERQTDDNHAA